MINIFINAVYLEFYDFSNVEKIKYVSTVLYFFVFNADYVCIFKQCNKRKKILACVLKSFNLVEKCYRPVFD